MLLGLLAAGSMNAFAAIGDLKTDGTYWYQVVNEAKAQVAFCGVGVVADPNPETITIKDKVTLKDDLNKDKEYTVVAVAKAGNVTSGGVISDFAWAAAVAGYTQNISSVKNLIIDMRIDTKNDATVYNNWNNVVGNAITAFGAGMESLKVKEAHNIPELEAVASPCPNLKNLDYSGVTNGGNPITLKLGFAYTLELKSIALPSEDLILEQGAFANVNDLGDPLDVSSFIGNVVDFGQQAFFEANVTGVVVGPKCYNVGPDAFAVIDPAKAFLKSVVWQTNKVVDPNVPNLPYVPAVFDGQKYINNIEISANKVNSIEAGAFEDVQTSAAAPLTVKLNGATSLTNLKSAFGATVPVFKVLELKDAPLTAANGEVNDIIDLSKSASTLATLTLPETIKKLAAGQFNSFTALSTIDLEKTTITLIPDNAFNACGNLKTFSLPKGTTSIGKYAFYQTKLGGIDIPATVESIGEYAFAEIYVTSTNAGKTSVNGFALTLADNSNLKTLGNNVFENTNVAGTVDFTKTKVKVIPAYAFAKTASLPTGSKNWWIRGNNWEKTASLEGVIINAGTDEGANKAEIGAWAFENNYYLATADLNKAFLTGIGIGAFYGTALPEVTLTDTKVKAIAQLAFAANPSLKTATLNAETTTILSYAFDGDIALATVNFDKLTKLANIDDYAFNQSAIKELNLKNCAALTHIGERAFGQYVKNEKKLVDPTAPEEIKATLTKITFPEEKATDPESTDADWKDKYTNKITDIEEAAFFAANKVTTIENEEALKIWTLNQWFTDNDEDNIDLATSAWGFSELEDDQIRYCPDGLTEFTLPSVTWKAKDNVVGIELEKVNHYALQGLGIEEITIPGSVWQFGGCVLQGCLNLKKFVFNDCNPEWPEYDPSIPGVVFYPGPALHKYTFRGNSNLEECYFMTTDQIAKYGLTDDHFFWCSKEKLQVYVTKESLLQLRADGYTTANAKYSKLNDTLEDTFTFSDNGFNEQDGYYYATYYDMTYSTWFDPSEVEVFSAYVKGNQIEMVPAEVENGYYKVGSYWSYGNDAVAIIRSKNKEVKKELYAIPANDINTLDAKNDLEVTFSEIPVSKLTFQFKLGKNKKTGAVGFFRIKTGTFKANTVFIQASSPARFADFIGVNGDATGIQNIEAAELEDGAIFNLQGIRVNEAQKGLYIKNGKKFVK